jgi:hypothetical protein
MNRQEAFDDIRDVWEEYVDIAHPEYTTTDKDIASELLDDIERLVKD